MTVYAIATIHIHDRSTYANYESGFMAVLANYDAKVLSVDENPWCWKANGHSLAL